MTHDLVVVGAGVAGLALARAARTRGVDTVVLERARGVGGRCATRRIEGQPVDHGVGFLHGREPAFLDALAALPDPVMRDWPRVRSGAGVPCQPEAFDVRERRLAPVAGVSRFPKHLARGLDVRLETEVARLRAPAGAGADAWGIELAGGGTIAARAVALTLPAPSVLELLGRMEPLPGEVAALLPLIGLVRTLPILAVIARYGADTPAPEWEAAFPETGPALHTVLHDSSKRVGEPALTLVLQSRPRFAERHLEEPPSSWSRALLDACAMLYGDAYARPLEVQAHAWRRARVADGTQLAGPLLARVGGARLGVAGDGFGASAGVEGAYRSGLALAARLTEDSAGSPA